MPRLVVLPSGNEFVTASMNEVLKEYDQLWKTPPGQTIDVNAPARALREKVQEKGIDHVAAMGRAAVTAVEEGRTQAPAPGLETPAIDALE